MDFFEREVGKVKKYCTEKICLVSKDDYVLSDHFQNKMRINYVCTDVHAC